MNVVVFWKEIKAMNKRQLINARKKNNNRRIMKICIDVFYLGESNSLVLHQATLKCKNQSITLQG